jgi:hypothetical protein
MAGGSSHAARQAEAAAAATLPLDDYDRRINAIAERYYAGHRPGPRIRGL